MKEKIFEIPLEKKNYFIFNLYNNLRQEKQNKKRDFSIPYEMRFHQKQRTVNQVVSFLNLLFITSEFVDMLMSMCMLVSKEIEVMVG